MRYHDTMPTQQGKLLDPTTITLQIEREQLSRLDAIVATNGLSRQETIRRMLAREIAVKERAAAKSTK